ncbi:MAG: beta-propeller fold lactonase family protein [Chloroflexi bacterium]|nr:beta-propeller fold lactonase family protein [Chloroflexota bacterium]
MSFRYLPRTALRVAVAALLLVASVVPTAASAPVGGVYTMSNAASGNAVIAYRRHADGSLTHIGDFSTGGLGSGTPRLSTQGSVTLSADNRWLLVTNPGSDDVSVFSVGADATPTLVARKPSGGDAPGSVTIHGNVVYVLNRGNDRVVGFRLNSAGQLARIPRGAVRISRGADAAQVQFNPGGTAIVVTEKATNLIDTYAVGSDGRLGPRMVTASSGLTPFGLAFDSPNHFVVTEAQEGIPFAASASAYTLDASAALTLVAGSVPDGRSEVCWTVVSSNGEYAYVTNFGSGDISSYRINDDGTIALLQSIAATTSSGFGPRDEDFSADGTYLYVIDIASRNVHAFVQNVDGTLTPAGAFGVLPLTVAGTAAY